MREEKRREQWNHEDDEEKRGEKEKEKEKEMERVEEERSCGKGVESASELAINCHSWHK